MGFREFVSQVARVLSRSSSPFQSKRHGIRGQVIAEDGKPVAGAVVDIFDDKDNKISTAVCDDNGYYEAEVPRPGSYSVTLKCDVPDNKLPSETIQVE